MLGYLQKIGKALMVPVAVLPAAAILLGIGYWLDPVAWGGNSTIAAFFIKAGASIIDSMPILFAVGVAYGMSKDSNGAAALSGLVSYLVLTTLLSPGSIALIKGIPMEEVPAGFAKINNQFIGILCGVISAGAYNKFSSVRLPNFISFFSGRRLVPIICSFLMMIVSFILVVVWPVIYSSLVLFGEIISELGPVGAGIYGFLNRLLIPVGLHHALNSVFWFDVAGINDIPNFLGGAQSLANGTATVGVTGMYQAGFFPIMMFGLLGACFAFIKTAKSENKGKIASIMLAAGFASFFTGVTEPVEFAFMFVAPGLYIIHAILTGISVFIAAQMQWMAGFGFSAGFIDLLLSTRNPLAVNWYMLVAQGFVFFILYYVIFYFAIKAFNLKTPGREEDEEDEKEEGEEVVAKPRKVKKEETYTSSELASNLLILLGGADNIIEVDNCATRLRLKVKKGSIVDEREIKKMIPGFVKQGTKNIQLIIGPHVEFVADDLKKLI